MHLRIPRHAKRWLLIATMCIGGIAEADQSPRYCEIAMDVSINGRQVATPSTIVEFGKEAEIMLSRDGTTGWELRILADEPTVVRRATAIPIEIAIYEIINGEAILRAAPHLRIAPGQRADVDTTFGEDDGRKAHMTLVANPRADAGAPALPDPADGAPSED